MKVLWVLYLIAGAPQSLGEFYTKEDCRKALEYAAANDFSNRWFWAGPTYVCSPYLASSEEGTP